MPNALKSPAKTTGLRYWMQRVLDECDHAGADFSADPVHDLRVALRRCRSLADGMIAMDPDPDWKAMKKAGKRLFKNVWRGHSCPRLSTKSKIRNRRRIRVRSSLIQQPKPRLNLRPRLHPSKISSRLIRLTSCSQP